MRRKKGEEGGGAIDEVEELLRAAQDDVLLKLSLNSHVARSSASSDLDPDLSRRFHALRSRPSAPAEPPQPRPPPPPPASSVASASASASASSSSSPSPRQVDDELKAVLGDDLSARFAALRGSLYPSSSSSSSDAAAAAAGGRDRREAGDLKSRGEDDRPKEEEDEVEKLIQWAVDAARLDPSPPSDDDDGPDDDNNDSDDDDDDDSDDESEPKKNRQKSKERPVRPGLARNFSRAIGELRFTAIPVVLEVDADICLEFEDRIMYICARHRKCDTIDEETLHAASNL